MELPCPKKLCLDDLIFCVLCVYVFYYFAFEFASGFVFLSQTQLQARETSLKFAVIC